MVGTSHGGEPELSGMRVSQGRSCRTKTETMYPKRPSLSSRISLLPGWLAPVLVVRTRPALRVSIPTRFSSGASGIPAASRSRHCCASTPKSRVDMSALLVFLKNLRNLCSSFALRNHSLEPTTVATVAEEPTGMIVHDVHNVRAHIPARIE